MSRQIGVIEGYEDTFIVTEFCGPASILDAPGNKDRLCLQIGDDMTLDRELATKLRDMLSEWLGDKRLIRRLPWRTRE